MDVTQRRIDRNEQILRDHQMHEPTCPVRIAEKAALVAPPGQTKKLPTPVCNCWLSIQVTA